MFRYVWYGMIAILFIAGVIKDIIKDDESMAVFAITLMFLTGFFEAILWLATH